jgi:hypothetical protein
MDYRKLFEDILSLNVKPFKVRYFKLIARINRFLFARKVYNYEELKSIPIIINNRNRYTYLVRLITWLEKNGYNNIHIIDNASTYEPLLSFYKNSSYNVFYLSENVGHLSLWKTGIIRQFEKGYYVYTDPDVVPVEDCPHDFMEYFYMTLQRYSHIEKVGFGLKIDDLPEHYKDREKVIEWESFFWKKEIEPNVYDAAIDTTFALYKPYTNGFNYVQNALRTGGNYQLHHLPWYEDSDNPLPEDLFYRKNIRKGASHWIVSS